MHRKNGRLDRLPLQLYRQVLLLSATCIEEQLRRLLTRNI